MPHRRQVNGDPPAGSLPPADTGILRERVYNLERNVLNTQGEIHEIRAVMATGEDVRQLQSNLAAIAAKMESAIAGISSEMRQHGKPQWPAISFALAFAVAIGALVYWPIREKQSDQNDRMSLLERTYVPREVHTREWQTRDDALKELRARTEKNQDSLTPREIFNQTTQSLQRQIEEIRKDVGGVVTTRDVLQATERKIDRLEADIRSMNGRARAP